jgi:hypothetical protein
VAEQVLLSVRRGWAHARCRPKTHDAPEAVGVTSYNTHAFTVLVVQSVLAPVGILRSQKLI